MFFKNVNEEMRWESPVKWYILSIVRAIIIGLLAVVGVAAAFFLLATALEYRPADRENIEVEGSAQTMDTETLKVMTWNIGYGALGDNTDFFMDGGQNVKTADAARVQQNLTDIAEEIQAEDPDVVFLQEVDKSSSRSNKIDEVEWMRASLPGRQLAFANNYKAFFVPYPVPPLGKIDSGLTTLSRYEMTEAERIALPCPFKWPVRTMNLKRCLLVSRVDLPDRDAQLVLVNLHLEAYSDDAGRTEQTKVLKEFMDAERAKGNYVIAGGDFNQTFATVDPERYPDLSGGWKAETIGEEDFGTDWQLLMDDSVPTCRYLYLPYENIDDENFEIFQYYMIDGFIVSDNLEMVSCETKNCGFVATDHNPVVLEVRLSE